MDQRLLARDLFERSVEAGRGDYLTRISAVYPWPPSAGDEAIKPEALEQLEDAWRARDFAAAFVILSDKKRVRRMPAQFGTNPYLASFRADPGQVAINPQLVREVVASLAQLPFRLDDLRVLFQLPIAASRQTNGFRKWVAGGGFIAGRHGFLNYPAFRSDKPGPWAVAGDDALLSSEAERLGVRLSNNKRLDLLARSRGGQAIAGEAKWVSQTGGTQNGSLTELLSLSERLRGPAVAVAVVDGYLWPQLAGKAPAQPASGPEREQADKGAELLNLMSTRANRSGEFYISALLLGELLYKL